VHNVHEIDKNFLCWYIIQKIRFLEFYSHLLCLHLLYYIITYYWPIELVSVINLTTEVSFFIEIGGRRLHCGNRVSLLGPWSEWAREPRWGSCGEFSGFWTRNIISTINLLCFNWSRSRLKMFRHCSLRTQLVVFHLPKLCRTFTVVQGAVNVLVIILLHEISEEVPLPPKTWV